MTIVGFAHPPELRCIVVESTPSLRWQVVVVQDMLDGADRVIQFALVELPFAPFLGKFPKLLFCVIQTITVGVRKVPSAVSMVQIFVDSINQRVDTTGTVPVFRAELGMG